MGRRRACFRAALKLLRVELQGDLRDAAHHPTPSPKQQPPVTPSPASTPREIVLVFTNNFAAATLLPVSTHCLPELLHSKGLSNLQEANSAQAASPISNLGIQCN